MTLQKCALIIYVSSANKVNSKPIYLTLRGLSAKILSTVIGNSTAKELTYTPSSDNLTVVVTVDV